MFEHQDTRPANRWARILAFVTGMVDQELLAQNEYLALHKTPM